MLVTLDEQEGGEEVQDRQSEQDKKLRHDMRSDSLRITTMLPTMSAAMRKRYISTVPSDTPCDSTGMLSSGISPKVADEMSPIR